MADRDEILDFCDQLLEIKRFDDYGPNGLQIPGAAAVSRVATGVTANLETLRRGAEEAELVLVHHGLFWNDAPRALSAPQAERLRALLDRDASLAAYHLPLDAHPEIGNNALLRERLGFERDRRPFGEHRGNAIGAIGTSPDGVEVSDLVRRVGELVQREPLVFDAGPARIHTIGIVSGAAAKSIHEAAALGLDAFLTGEPAEHAMGDAREAGLHFVAAGHYATETLGIRRLGELVAERFGVEHRFVDVPNPV
jgi:dinuclear metal center YbgI/SA1388 family protein